MEVDWSSMPEVYAAYRELLNQEVPPMEAMGEAIEKCLKLLEESNNEVGSETRG